jgi:hypothetical protein
MAAGKAIGDPRRWCDEPIQPMTLGNMRQNRVPGLFVTCSACGYHTEVNVDAGPMMFRCHPSPAYEVH